MIQMTDNRPDNEKFAEVVKQASTVFQDIDRALSWLNSPCHDLGDQIPIHLFETADGLKVVKATLDRMAITAKN
jgi:putative toxin-antitoxin system antitoxin component (TIGR02293 family)